LDRVGCFTYSPVEGAKANDLPHLIPEDVKQARYEQFMQVQANISAQRLQKKIGKTLTVLIDEIDGDLAIARSYADAPEIDGKVYIADAGDLKPGQVVAVQVVGSDEYDLDAVLMS